MGVSGGVTAVDPVSVDAMLTVAMKLAVKRARRR